ncbi:MAG TPA: superoxide dismutase family protein [Mycobacterium sp.]|uniref:superoxide dismutase family protein n=1 Tax=Mycobacterium sp. TaxID=1785 RepID=UPI002BEEDA54|nr:superoxide dismutase family protein [Mycobacterium sp.]HME77410.1 superoxide dismutase family protein [Mycobacterium sp.]
MSKHTKVVVATLSAVVALSACSSHQQSTTSSSTTSTPAGAQTLSAELHTADGRSVATATFEFANGYATVTVTTTTNGILAPGLHGMHIHEIGKCEPNSVDPMGGAPGDFMSAGMHYQAPGHTGEPPSGDLSTLDVRKDGAAYLVTTTDAFTRDDLLAGSKTALMVHGVESGPDAEKRIACGVIGTG